MSDEPIQGDSVAGDSEAGDSASGRRDLSARVLARSFLEFVALSGVAFAQPTFDLLSKSPGLFYTRGTTGLQAVTLTLLILLVPPAACLLIEAGIGALIPRSRRFVHAALASILLAVIATEVLKKATSLGPNTLLVLGAMLGIGGGLLVLRADVVRQFLRVLSVAPVIFALLFLVASPVTDVVFSGQTAAAANVGIARPKRVVFIVFDEFPEESLLDGTGHIDAQLYPHFARFATDATWYRNDTTVAPYTQWAVPPILTGIDPKGKGYVPDATQYPNSLFTLLGKVYRMNVHEPVTRMCPQQLCKTATGSGFGSLIDQSVHLWKTFASPHRTALSFNFTDAAEGALDTSVPVAEKFVDSIGPTDKPQLDFAHIELPHQPWQFISTLQRYDVAGTFSVVFYNQPAVTLARARHLLQVQATDTALGQVIAKLKQSGAYDDSLIVVTADHGAAFTNGQPNRTVTAQNYPQIMWTPLFIKYPGESGKGKIDDRPAQSVDVIPTVADVIGAKVPWHVDGTSLLGPVQPEFPRRMYQYKIATKQVANAPSVTSDKPYLTFDGPAGFAQVLKGRAAPPGGDPNLRIYRVGEYGGLVGKSPDPYLGAPIRGGLAVRNLEKFDNIDKSAKVVPWVDNDGFIGPLTGHRWVAIAVNGRIAMVTPTEPLKDNGEHIEFLVPPELLHDGKNSLSAYVVSGTPAKPVLQPVSVSSAKY